MPHAVHHRNACKRKYPAHRKDTGGGPPKTSPLSHQNGRRLHLRNPPLRAPLPYPRSSRSPCRSSHCKSCSAASQWSARGIPGCNSHRWGSALRQEINQSFHLSINQAIQEDKQELPGDEKHAERVGVRREAEKHDSNADGGLTNLPPLGHACGHDLTLSETKKEACPTHTQRMQTLHNSRHSHASLPPSLSPTPPPLIVTRIPNTLHNLRKSYSPPRAATPP